MTNENEINTMSNPLEGAYAIEYNYEGGTSDMMPLQLVLPGGYFIVHDAPTKEGYIFQYWYDENGKSYDEGEVVFPSGNIFLRPYWISVPYTLTFDLNGGEGEFHEFNESAGIFVTIPEVVPTKEGFWFSYWISNDGTVYHPLEPYVMQEKNDTLTAVWEERETFTVTYDLDGGTPEIASVTVLEGEEYTLPEIYPEKEKYFFTGWIDKDNPDGEMYFPGYTYVIEKNLNLKACLKRFYTIVYDVNGGNETIYDGFAEAEFSYWIASEIPAKERHTFLYWVDQNGNIYYPEQEFIPTDDVTLTAVWDEHELCTITYDLDGGTPEIPSASVYQYESYTVPEVFPEKEGFFFTYWYDEANDVGCNLYEPFIVEKSLNLKAQWYPNPYNVTFDYNGGEGTSSGDCYFPETDVPVLLPTATKGGCNFLYWIDENNNTYNAGDYIRPTGDMTLTAVWERYAYAISYDEGNIESTVVNIGESYTVTDIIPTKEHHTFLHWEDGENNVYASGDTFTPTDDVAFCAVWEEDTKFTVTYDLDGGTPETPSVTVYEGESYTVSSVIPEKEGYYFSAWEDSETSERYFPEHTFIVTKGITLKAVWTPNPYLVTYDAGEEQPFHSEYVEVGMSTSVISSIPEKEGYSFLHWSDGNGNTYVSGDAFTPTSDTELTAVWEVETYYVTYDLAGGEGSFPEQIKTYGVDIVLHEGTPTKEGYSFICWRDGEGNAHSPKEIYSTNKSLSLTAVWSYTLTFDMNGAESEIEAVTKNEGEYVSLSDIPTREGYDFDGFENKNGEYYSRYVFDKGEDTLRAIWKEKRYLVTYDLNGGEGSFPTQEKSYFAPITLHEGVPSKLDTVFVTWKTEDGRSFVPNALYEINESLQLKAFWENEITYTVVYNVDSGEGNFPEQIKTHGIDLPLYDEVPTREGYTFLHWRDESGRTYLPGEVYSENEGVTLTAVWTATLTFDINGGEGEIEAMTKEKGETVTLSDVPEKEGLELAYWIGTDGTIYSVNGEYVFNKGNDTLTAVWREKTVTVTYNLDGGEGFFPEQEKGYFDTVTLHTNTPTKEGYEFLGWRDARYNYYDGVTEYSGTENLTLIARWRRVYTITYLDQNGNVFATQQKYHGEIIRLYNETPESSDGSWFAYWVIKETGEYAAAGRKFKKNLDATLRPCYDKYYDVTYYDSDGETVLDEHGILGGTRTIPSSVPTKSGYTFLCWNLDGTNRYYLPGESFDLDSHMAFIAVWVETNNTTIVYELGEAEGDFPEQTADGDIFITMYDDVPEKEGYLFDCWEVVKTIPSSNVVGLKLSPGMELPRDYSMVLRPIWIKPWVKIKNTPSGNSVNIFDTTTLQLEAEYYPTENDFSVTTSASAVNEDEGVSTYALSRTIFCLVNHFWSSSNEDVATVDQNGNVTLKGVGETTITVITTHRRYLKEVYSRIEWKVTVYEEPYNVFTSASSEFDALPEDIKEKALAKMNEYYNDNNEIRDVVDGNDSDCNTCIFAFEGLGGNVGVENNLHLNGFLKAMMVVTKGRDIVYVTRNASTLPDNRPDPIPSYSATTTVNPGIYEYYIGDHGDYIALRQKEYSRKSWYLPGETSDNTRKFKEGTAGGINIHATLNRPPFSGGPFSAGCQTVYYEDYVDFGKAVGFLDPLTSYSSELDPAKGLSSYMKDLVGSINSFETTNFPKTIKYILDREEDINNGPTSEYPYGIFYPINESGITTD